MHRGYALALVLFWQVGSAAAETNHELKIGVFANGILSQADATDAVGKVNALMLNSGHSRCEGVTFELTRGPEKFGAGTPSYVGDGNFDKFRNSGFSINIVSQVLECGGFVVTRGNSFGGCTSVGAFPVVVTPGRLRTRHLLWLHELGHSQGLHDRCDNRPDGCRSNIGWVMAGVLDKRNLKLSEDECRAYDGEQNFPILIEGDNALPEDIQDILERDWHHAMPVVEILAFNAEDLQTLRGFLAEEDHSLWPNAVLALGLTGKEEDLDLIIRVLDQPIATDSGEIDFDVVDAKLNVPVALGYLANRTQSETVVEKLSALTEPTGNMPLFGGFEDTDASTEYSVALARNVAVGLALSDMVAARPQSVRANEIFNEKFRTATRAPILQIDDDFVTRLDELSRDVSARGLVAVLQEDASEN